MTSMLPPGAGTEADVAVSADEHLCSQHVAGTDNIPWPPSRDDPRIADLEARNRDLVAAVGDYEGQGAAFRRLFHVWLDLVRHDFAALEGARAEIDRAVEALFEQERTRIEILQRAKSRKDGWSFHVIEATRGKAEAERWWNSRTSRGAQRPRKRDREAPTSRPDHAAERQPT